MVQGRHGKRPVWFSVSRKVNTTENLIFLACIVLNLWWPDLHLDFEPMQNCLLATSTTTENVDAMMGIDASTEGDN